LARAFGRPGRGGYLVQLGPETYEVVDFRGGGRKVFRLELVYVEAGSPEHHEVVSVIEEARAQGVKT